MFVEMRLPNQTEKEKREFYDVLIALCQREEIQIEEKGDQVVILPCPQGKIIVKEDDRDLILSSNTRHAGPGFHAFAVEFFLDIQTELSKSFEIYDDLKYDQDANFDRLVQIYEDEITYMKGLLKEDPTMRRMNMLYDETFFYPLIREGKIPTILGYLDEEVFQRMSEKELMPYFYIWNDWDKDALYYRQCALFRYVKDTAGIYTSSNELSTKYAHEVCDCLELAHSLDPYIALPMDVYQDCASALQRTNGLQECIAMEQSMTPYRTQDVYHLYQDMQIVASGAALRSVDPIGQSLHLMAPYQNEEQWHWLIQASDNDSICQRKEELEEKDLIQYTQEGHHVIEAKKGEGKPMYFHCIVNDEKDIDYILSCIERSERMPHPGS